jgi:hypothetical protein
MASLTQPPYSTPRPRVIWGGGTDSNTTQSSLTTAGLALAADGLPVFPCNAIKKPIVDQGFKDATRDPETATDCPKLELVPSQAPAAPSSIMANGPFSFSSA